MTGLGEKFMKFEINTITSRKDVLGGTPVFDGTRVPISALLDCLEQGDSIDLFLADFPSVKRQQVIEVLEAIRRGVMESAPA